MYWHSEIRVCAWKFEMTRYTCSQHHAIMNVLPGYIMQCFLEKKVKWGEEWSTATGSTASGFRGCN